MMMGFFSVPSLPGPQAVSISAMTLNRTRITNQKFFFICFFSFSLPDNEKRLYSAQWIVYSIRLTPFTHSLTELAKHPGI